LAEQVLPVDVIEKREQPLVVLRQEAESA